MHILLCQKRYNFIFIFINKQTMYDFPPLVDWPIQFHDFVLMYVCICIGICIFQFVFVFHDKKENLHTKNSPLIHLALNLIFQHKTCLTFATWQMINTMSHPHAFVDTHTWWCGCCSTSWWPPSSPPSPLPPCQLVKGCWAPWSPFQMSQSSTSSATPPVQVPQLYVWSREVLNLSSSLWRFSKEHGLQTCQSSPKRDSCSPIQAPPHYHQTWLLPQLLKGRRQ